MQLKHTLCYWLPCSWYRFHFRRMTIVDVFKFVLVADDPVLSLNYSYSSWIID